MPPSCFIPQPKVTSSVITLRTRKAPPCPIDDEQTFFRVVRSSFAMRRKTLVNGLAAGFPHLGKDRLAAILEDTGFSPQIRGERLSIEAFARIANAIYREH